MDRAQPVAVALTGVTAMGAGTAHTCAQTSAGLQCWGRNAEGQLGLDRSDPFISTPTIVTGATARSLGLGREHSCIVDASGARCWGGNTRGQVGDGSTTPRPRPVAVEGLVAAPVQVAARGSHTCALLETGQVQCWGDNSFGQLGTGASSSAPAPTPRLVVAIDDAVEVAAGSTHTCARRRSGEVWCWGSNAFGQVGDGTVRNERPQPTRAGSLTDATQLTAGVDHSCALDAAGAVWCWGNNTDGQLGIDNTVPGGVIEMPTPTRVASLDPADRIGAGDAHTCVRLAGGGYRCWGFNESGQLGDGTMSATFTPVAVEWP
jgi:alpha-tubulin suppressor-like RCC1 family protein